MPAHFRLLFALCVAGAVLSAIPLPALARDYWHQTTYIHPVEREPGSFAAEYQLATAEVRRLRGLTVRQLYFELYALERFKGRRPMQARMYSQDFRVYGPEDLTARRQALQELQAQLQAACSPPIPAWLGVLPPCLAVFAQDGSIWCFGALGQRSGLDGATPAVTWRRYSARGQLLEELPGTAEVSRIVQGDRFSAAAAEAERRELAGQACDVFGTNDLYCVADPGIRFVAAPRIYPYSPYDPPYFVLGPPPELYAAFDAYGNPLELDGPLPPHGGTVFSAEELALTYACQLKLGLASADSLSPFTGRPDGPLLATPEQQAEPPPAVPPLTATSYAGNAGSAVEVKPLADPANPYRGSYSAWEPWALERIDPALLNDSIYEDIYGNRLGDPGFFKMTATYAEIRLSVDPQGYVIPFAAAWASNKRQELAADVRRERWDDQALDPAALGYTVFAHCRTSEALEIRRDQRRAELALLPPVPAWLASQPVRQAVLLPDGGCCTLGALGSYDPAGDFIGSGRTSGEITWRRYSADGEQLAQLPSGPASRTEWVELTWPGFRARRDVEEQAGNSVYTANGYTLVRRGPRFTTPTLREYLGPDAELGPEEALVRVAQWSRYELLALYDYDGAALPLDRPAGRPDGTCLALNWEQLNPEQHYAACKAAYADGSWQKNQAGDRRQSSAATSLH